VIVVGANDLCPELTVGAPWVGFYRSADGGRTWSARLVPGYPSDLSKAGRTSPTFKRCSAASDPTVGFDLHGRLFFGFACFSARFGSSTFVATYDRHGSRYVRTVVLARSRRQTETEGAVVQDKINVVVDQTSGPRSGTVYAAWVQFGFNRSESTVLVARSTDSGRNFSEPVIATPGLPGLSPDLAVGPTGILYLTFRNFPKVSAESGQFIGLTFSPNGGRTFTAVTKVATIRPFDSSRFSGGPGRTCGDGLYACRSGYTFPRFISTSAVAADRAGVHVAWAGRLRDGQSKVFVRTSPDGATWNTETRPVDRVRRGHQFFPDIASSSGALTAVFYDSRSDRTYSPSRPPGNDAQGKAAGPFLDVYVAVSTDGGVSWRERRVTSSRSNMNLELPTLQGSGAPFFGDYIYISAVEGRAFVVWTDSRDMRAKARSTQVHAGTRSCHIPLLMCLGSRAFDQNIYGSLIGMALSRRTLRAMRTPPPA
jgi:hypothetical protein